MKKLTALLLCILLLSVCSVVAYADNVGIGTYVPDSHTVTVNVTGNATVTLDGKTGSTFTVERLSEPTLLFTPAEGEEIAKIALNGEELTDRFVNGRYKLPPVYEDLTLEVETKAAESPAAGVRYSITDVAGVDDSTGIAGSGEKVWTKGSSEDVVITVKDVEGEDDSFEHFVGVVLDGVTLTRDVDYTVRKGSTIVTFSAEIMQKLSVGEHNVTVKFDNGEVSTALTVIEATGEDSTSPKTGDNIILILWVALVSLSVCCIEFTALYGRKKKKAFDK